MLDLYIITITDMKKEQSHTRKENHTRMEKKKENHTRKENFFFFFSPFPFYSLSLKSQVMLPGVLQREIKERFANLATTVFKTEWQRSFLLFFFFSELHMTTTSKKYLFK